MRISARADYAIRATVQLAAQQSAGPVKAAVVAQAQDIPLNFLHAVLGELKKARIVRSTRGPEGGFELSRPAADITLADVYRAVDGPLINVRDTSLSELYYAGPADLLRDVWMAARSSLRSVLEQVTLEDLITGRLAAPVTAMAQRYRTDIRHPN